RIEKIIGTQFVKARIPTGNQVCQKQLFQIINKMENVDMSHEDEIAPFLPEIYKRLEWISKEDLIQRFVSVEFNRFLDYYRNAPDLNVDEDEEKYSEKKSGKSDRSRNGDRDRGDRKKSDKNGKGQYSGNFATIKINMGRKSGTVPQRIIGILNETVKNRDMKIGHIDIFDNFSHVEVEAKYLERVFDAFDNRYDNRYYIEFVDGPNSDKAKDKKKGKPRKNGDDKKKRRR
ncbi:DbpA RNA binding domain-containing protein, partial [Bacteroidales bacterium OttesenSCG-928-K03]|nr:DbpA RNA binding domain-containing protein [Bacteroidales bacterium OttesenSCG-928-K03]